MARVYGGLKWWHWLIVAGWAGATANMYGPSLRPSEPGIVVGTFIAAYLILYGLRWLWGFGKNSEEDDGGHVAPGGGIVSDQTPEQRGSR